MENQELDTLIIKYISGEISNQELEQLKRMEGFSTYEKILEYSSDFKAPAINNEVSYANFLKKHKRKSKPVVKLNRSYIISGIAATLLIFFGIFQFSLNTNQKYKTNFGEQLAVILPDSSEVILHASSSLNFNEKNWKTSRIVNLEGEAYFKVKKGSKFKVITNEGKVSVLGTQFTVNEQEDFFEVHCFEGKVMVERNGAEKIVIRGEAIRQIQNGVFEEWRITTTKPSWQNFESNFNNTPLHYVFNNIKKVYGVDIIVENVNTEKRFSGSIPNNNLQVAIATVAQAMHLNYEIVNNKKVIFRP